jgi:hypothetical protein
MDAWEEVALHHQDWPIVAVNPSGMNQKQVAESGVGLG